MASHPKSHLEASKFNFNYPHQSEDWKVCYNWAIDYLEALDINAEEADDCHTGWKQLKMMFEGEDRHTPQSLITVESQWMPQCALDAIRTNIKSEEHFWHFQDELLSDICQLSNEGIHALSTQISTLISQCKFPHLKTQEMLKIMVLQYTV